MQQQPQQPTTVTQTKKPVSTSTVLITIAFLAIFIVMPPLCRVLYPKEEKIADTEDTEEMEMDLPGLTCTKEYGTIGINLISTSSHSNGSIIANELMASIIPKSGDEVDSSEQEEYTKLFASILGGVDASKVTKTDTYTQFTLDSTTSAFVQQNANASLHWKSKEELRTYYEELGFSCSDTENTIEEEIPEQQTEVPETSDTTESTDTTTPEPATPEVPVTPEVNAPPATPVDPNGTTQVEENAPEIAEPK
ncbi:MAG: hypothetical protein IJ193_01965 [Bacilli bacterium]|nr:hypothetical protein [Bacilli bacterium]